MTTRPANIQKLGQQLDTDLTLLPILHSIYVSGAGKTSVTDADFPAKVPDGVLAVHYDSLGTNAYLSVRANGTWHVMAGPIA